jgi:acetyltransferase-like isoleucine patch superfamily enzyme
VTTTEPFHESRPAVPAASEQAPKRSLLETLDFLQNNGLAHLRARRQLRGAEIAPRVRLWGRVHMRNQGVFRVGARTRLIATVTPLELMIGPEGRLEIGERVYINYGTSIGASLAVTIGDRCNIGSYVIILDNNQHCVEPERRLELPPSQPVVIEENVWLGSRVTVLPGVRIGAHSVVGAGSVVARDIPPRTLAAGVPARVIRQI